MSELDQAKIRRLNRLVFMARCVVMWERLWPRLWPFLILSSLSLSAILFDLFSLLPGAIHLLAIGCIALAGFGLLVLAFREISLPDKKDGLHRLEKDSGLKNQPLFSLLDKPAVAENNRLAMALWINHQDRMAAAMDKVQLRAPKSHLWKRDPYSLRAALILLLVLGVIEARFDFIDRFERAFIPMNTPTAIQNWAAQIWITPPEHTGLTTHVLEVDAKTPSQNSIQIPQHSTLLIRLEGKPTQDRISLFFGPYQEDLENLGRGIFSLETQLDRGKQLALKRKEDTLFSWPIEIIPDQPPEIELAESAQKGFRGHLSIAFKAEDDYGVKEVGLEIKSLNPSPVEPITLSQAADSKEAKGRFRQNLAEHPWAGTEVIVSPKAIDNAEQTAIGKAIRLTLPERRFSHPVAVRLIQIRKNLYEDKHEQRMYARMWLARLLKKPEDFKNQISVYFPLRVAAHRLKIKMDQNEITNVQDILWQTAVHLDEGASGTVRNQLEDLAQRMQELLKENGQKGDMEALFEQMRQSLQKYMQHMSKSNEGMENLKEAVGPENAEMIGQDELHSLLEKARELMRSGNMKAAQALMEQFQSILSRLAMQQEIDPARAKAAKLVMDELRQIKEEQQKLLDRTFQRTRNQDRPSIDSTTKAIQESLDQTELERRLKAQMQKIKKMRAKVPNNLNDAARSMQRAARSLDRGLDEDAVQAQMRALDQLSQGLKDSATSLARSMGRQPMPQRLPGYDPLGRGVRGPIDVNQGNMVPSEGEIHRSREILQELYRRAGQKGRTDQELNYIERLLERF
jgi:flagellin-specific chaperone FliS